MVEGAAVDPGVARVVGGTDRLDEVRGLLRRLENRGGRPGVEPGVDGRVLPVVPPLDELLPWCGLRRGVTVALAAESAGVGAGLAGTGGATSLLLALIARVSAAGVWAGVVGRPDLGLVAAAEAGIVPGRLALVPYPGADLVAVTAALLDGLDLVAVSCAGAALRAADRQRLAARARQRGSVVVALGPWPGADVELACVRADWHGVDDAGGGRLRSRRVHVRVRGRSVAPAGREAALLLPGPDGRPAALEPPADGRWQEVG